ncbi:MAG: hypothetical protein RL761_637, partial [Pseudomonadota bacterium]
VGHSCNESPVIDLYYSKVYVEWLGKCLRFLLKYARILDKYCLK